MVSIIIVIKIVSSETSLPLDHLNRIFANNIYRIIFLFVMIQHLVSWRPQEIKILIGWNMNFFSHKLTKLNKNFTGKIYSNIFLEEKKECMISWPLIMNHNGFWLAEYKKRIFWSFCSPIGSLNSNMVWMIYTES